MVSILADYFDVIDSELFFWLRVLIALPFAVVLRIAAWLHRRLRTLRFQAAASLIGFTFWLLPSRSTIRVQLAFLMRDLAAYRRYSGWCELAGQRRLPFESWRAERAWVGCKMRRLESPHAE